ncbi:rnase h domain-containing protein [Citrus sinensis]|nr:rnase h domain-containing protein [Citrus sinensis]
MWRAVKNLLPTASNLWKRKIVVELVCVRCGCRREDVAHALLECKAARRVWKKTEFYEDIKMMAQQDILSMIQEVALKRSKEGMEMGKQEDPLLPIARAEAIVESYKRIKCSNDQAALKAPRKKIQAWMAPPEGWYKVNVDAAINTSAQQAGLGVVIRNSRGKIIAAAVKRVLYRGSVMDIEAEAILFGIQNAFQVNCRPMIIESDSSEVVELSINRKGSLAEIAWTIADIQLFLKNQDPSRIQYVPRACNALADSLAKLALSFERPALWLENFPENVLLLFSKSV